MFELYADASGQSFKPVGTAVWFCCWHVFLQYLAIVLIVSGVETIVGSIGDVMQAPGGRAKVKEYGYDRSESLMGPLRINLPDETLR